VKLARKRGANEKCHFAGAFAKLGARITETAIFLLAMLEKGGRGNVNKKSREEGAGREMARRCDDILSELSYRAARNCDFPSGRSITSS